MGNGAFLEVFAAEGQNVNEGFPGGVVVKNQLTRYIFLPGSGRNPPTNAGDTGSSPGPGRSHMPRSS